MNTLQNTSPEDVPQGSNSVRSFNYHGRRIEAQAVDFNQQFRDILNPKETLYGETE